MVISVFKARGKIAHRISPILVFLALCLIPSLASAQTVNQFTSSIAGDIVDSPNCTTTVTRTFSVATSFSVTDVDFGVLLTHKYRSDLRITLTSPAGTTVQLMNAVGGGENNLNVLFDDEAAAAISSHTLNDPSSGAPPYSKTFRPGAALTAFDGQNAQGIWTMIICDLVARDEGTFTRADLYITQVPASFADLSLTKIVSNGNPSPGANVIYTLTVNNAAASNVSATGLTIRDILPLGVTFVSATGAGTYNSVSGVWTVGTLARNSSVTIAITVSVTASDGALVMNSAEIIASSADDIDSTPNNGVITEDDIAFASLTVSSSRTAGVVPTLVCPVGSTLFDWDTENWVAGATNVSSAVANLGTINFNIVIGNGVFVNSAGNGGQSPARQTNFTGGNLPVQSSLILLTDFANRSSSVTTTISLPTAVPGAQFSLFDVDYAVNEFADRVMITGAFNGAAVTPTLTNNLANYIIGNTGYGDGNAASNSANGTVVVTFSTPVDTIVIVYGSHSIAPTNPFQQAISIHDINFCRPQANISVTKVSSVLSDGISGANPKALPEAIVSYCILVTNAGSATATGVSFADVIPATLSYIPGTMVSGPSCAAAKTVEDDDASGSDDSDQIGASISGSTINAIASTMGPNSAFALIFNAAVN